MPKTKQSLVALALFCGIIYAPVNAEMAATPLSGDTRLVTFEYDQENTYLVLTKPKAHTHIKIPEGEAIETVMAGDTANWEITATNNMKHVFIKPKYEDIQTTLTIITTNKTFQLVLRSTGEGRKWYQQVAWEIAKGFVFDFSGHTPAKENDVEGQKIASHSDFSIDPSKLNYEYKINGSENFTPTQVFDDGKMIWLKMPSNLNEMPAFFAKEGGDLVLVNYVVRGDFVIIQQLAKEIILKIAKREVKISKGKHSFWNPDNNYGY